MTIPQHQVAFEKAKRIKEAHARLSSELRSLEPAQARALAAALLDAVEPDTALGALKVRKFLQMLPWIGEQAADRLLDAVGVFQTAMTCRWRELTDRQRRELAGLLRSDAERWERAA